HARVRIRDPEHLQHALDASILPEGPVKSVERDIRPETRENLGNVALNIDARDTVTGLLERIGTAVPGRQRHGPFAGPATHQHRDVAAHSWAPTGYVPSGSHSNMMRSRARS